jgi:hypothetical protein
LSAHENLHRSRLPPPGVGYNAYVFNVCEAQVPFPEIKAPIGLISAPLTGDSFRAKNTASAGIILRPKPLTMQLQLIMGDLAYYFTLNCNVSHKKGD